MNDESISVDDNSQRILYNGLPFDNVVFKDGYIEPCDKPIVDQEEEKTPSPYLNCVETYHRDFIECYEIPTFEPSFQMLSLGNNATPTTCSLNVSPSPSAPPEKRSTKTSKSKSASSSSPVLNVERSLKKLVRSFR